MISGFEMVGEDGSVLAKAETGAGLLKAHVQGYTRKDGTYVAEHDDRRQAAHPEHRRIVDAATYSAGAHEEHSATHTDEFSSRTMRVPADKAKHAVDHAREVFSLAGLKHVRNNTITGAGQYESDTHTGEIRNLPGELHVAVKKKAAAGSANAKSADPAPGEVGHEELQKYGRYFRRGDKVKDNRGNVHTVVEHRGPQVFVEGSIDHFHPTKLHHVESAPMRKSEPAFVMVGEDGAVLAKAATGADLVKSALSAKARAHLPKRDFAEPGDRAFPIEDAAHARDAKARASEEANDGEISGASEARIDAKANKVLRPK